MHIQLMVIDASSVRHWRIETYEAASARSGFTEYAETRMWNVSLHIVKALLLFAPKSTLEALMKSFFEAIAKPAFSLARKMHLCFDEYTLEWSAYHDRALQDAGATFEKENSERFQNYEFVSLTDRKVLREKPKPGDDGEGVRVRWLFDMAPKLVFRRLKADAWSEGKVLVKPKVLVRVYKPKRVNSLTVKQEDGYKTLLGEVQGWLDRQLYLIEREREKERERQRREKPVGLLGLFAS